jgi:hypothetical protein
MEDIASIKTDVSELINDISRYLEQTRDGIMVDIGALPEQIVRLQGRMQSAPKQQRAELSNFMKQVMQALNELAAEIQLRHDSLARNIDKFDGAVHKE